MKTKEEKLLQGLSKKKRKRKPSGKTTTRFSRIRGLTCYETVVERLRAGFPLKDVAKFIQDDQMEYTDVSRASLISMLSAFRKEMKSTEMIAARAPEVVREAEEKIRKGLDELEEMEKLYGIQMGRIKLGVDVEKVIRFHNKNLASEVAIALAILKARHDVKMDLGLNGSKDLGTMTIRPELMLNVKEKYGDGVHAAISNPESRGKVLSIARKLMSSKVEVIDQDEPEGQEELDANG